MLIISDKYGNVRFPFVCKKSSTFAMPKQRYDFFMIREEKERMCYQCYWSRYVQAGSPGTVLMSKRYPRERVFLRCGHPSHKHPCLHKDSAFRCFWHETVSEHKERVKALFGGKR